jgi:hypothetical protein
VGYEEEEEAEEETEEEEEDDDDDDDDFVVVVVVVEVAELSDDEVDDEDDLRLRGVDNGDDNEENPEISLAVTEEDVDSDDLDDVKEEDVEDEEDDDDDDGDGDVVNENVDRNSFVDAFPDHILSLLSKLSPPSLPPYLLKSGGNVIESLFFNVLSFINVLGDNFKLGVPVLVSSLSLLLSLSISSSSSSIFLFLSSLTFGIIKLTSCATGVFNLSLSSQLPLPPLSPPLPLTPLPLPLPLPLPPIPQLPITHLISISSFSCLSFLSSSFSFSLSFLRQTITYNVIHTIYIHSLKKKNTIKIKIKQK